MRLEETRLTLQEFQWLSAMAAALVHTPLSEQYIQETLDRVISQIREHPAQIHQRSFRETFQTLLLPDAIDLMAKASSLQQSSKRFAGNSAPANAPPPAK